MPVVSSQSFWWGRRYLVCTQGGHLHTVCRSICDLGHKSWHELDLTYEGETPNMECTVRWIHTSDGRSSPLLVIAVCLIVRGVNTSPGVGQHRDQHKPRIQDERSCEGLGMSCYCLKFGNSYAWKFSSEAILSRFSATLESSKTLLLYTWFHHSCFKQWAEQCCWMLTMSHSL